MQMKSLRCECECVGRASTQVEVSEAMGVSCILLCKYLHTHKCVGIKICLSPCQREHRHGHVCLCCPDVTIPGCVCVCMSVHFMK